VATLGLAVAWLVHARPWLGGTVTIPWDAKSQFWPHLVFLARSFQDGQSPFWNPYLFAGQAHIADPQALLFQPIFLLLALLDPEPDFRSFDAAVLALPLLAGLGVLLWCRDLRLHPAAALLAAVATMAGGSAAWRLQHVGQLHSLACLPWLLLLLDRTIARGSWPPGLMAGLVAALLLLGRDQVALLGAYLALGFVLARLFVGPGRAARLRASLGPLAAGALLAILLVALPLLLSLLEATRSTRVEIDLEGAGRGSLHPAHLLTLLTPHLFGSGGPMADFWGPPSFAWPDTGLFVAQNMGVLYMGAPALLLLLAAGPALARAPHGAFLGAAAALLLAYGLGWHTPILALAWHLLPGVDLYRRPADATFLLGLLLAILAGAGLDRLLREGPGRLRSAAAAAAFGLLAATLLAVWRGRLAQAAGPLLEAGLWLALAAALLVWTVRTAPARRVVPGAMLLLVALLDLARNNGPNGASGLPAAGPEVDWTVLAPDGRDPLLALLRERAEAAGARRDRVELVGLGYPWPNVPMVHGLEHTLGHNPVRSARYVAAVGAQDTVAGPGQRPFTPAFASWRSPLADRLGLRWIATPVPIEELDGTLGADPLPLVARTAGAFLYESRTALPRVRVVPHWRRIEPRAILTQGVWPEIDPAATVLLEEAPPAPLPGPDARSGTARILRYDHAEVVVAAEAADGGFLVLHDLDHPWWRAELDGARVPILRADLLFRAVQLPPGRHTVRFRFAPLAGALGEVLGDAPATADRGGR
jgi:hypothetical protein